MKKHSLDHNIPLIPTEKTAAIEPQDTLDIYAEEFEDNTLELDTIIPAGEPTEIIAQMPKGVQKQQVTFNFSDGQSVTYAISVNWHNSQLATLKTITEFHLPICMMLDDIAYKFNKHSLKDIISAVSGCEVKEVKSEWSYSQLGDYYCINLEFTNDFASLIGINENNSYGYEDTINLQEVFQIESLENY